MCICYNSDAVWNAEKTNAPLKVRRELGCGGSPLVEAMRVSLILRTLNISKIGHGDFTLFLGV